ncbi:MAG: cytochrome c3 family protein [Bacteroidota bacterium]
MKILYPSLQDSTSYDEGRTLLVSMEKDSTGFLLVSTQWQLLKYINFSDSAAKGNFPKTFLQYFKPHTTIQKLWYTFQISNYFTAPESVTFKYTDTMNVRTFWQRPEFATLLKEVKEAQANYLILNIAGWIDTSCTTPYDDPNADNHGLYKLHIRLVPGVNTIYFAPSGKKNDAMEFTTSYVNESKPLDARTSHFHNSDLEKSCTPCHEGLPSADSGASMKADCPVCHKMPPPDLTIHSPVEMKECGTCHSWSAEKKIMMVTKGVPDACFDCHPDKKTSIDSSKSAHPVASDCTICHSPHSSKVTTLLKKNIYELCTGCHDEQRLNHPVGKHPLRFALTKTGEEISCVSCHNPHGSDNEHLLAMGGGPMAVCVKCHQ